MEVALKLLKHHSRGKGGGHNLGHGGGGQARTEQDGDSSNQLFLERVTCSCPRGIQSAGGIQSETAKEKEECPLSSGKDGHEGRMTEASTFQEELTGPWMPGLQKSFLVPGMNSK